MKKLTLILLLASITVNARNSGEDNHTPESKYEINILAGRGLNLEDFKLINNYYASYYFSNICFYKNFNRLQVGIGVEVEPVRAKQMKKVLLSYFAPHLLLNTTYEMEDLSLYAGVMGGFAKDNTSSDQYLTDGVTGTRWETTGSGVVGGLQVGILFKLHKFIALNAELAGRIREMKYTTTTQHFGNIGPGVPPISVSNYGRSSFYLPFKLGIRVRI